MLNEGEVGKISYFRPLSRRVSESAQGRTKVAVVAYLGFG